MQSTSFRLFVIGASAGGQSAVKVALTNIPASINAAFLVVVHSAYNTTSYLVKHLEGKIALKVVEASDNLEIKPGTVYISVPDKHMIVAEGMIKLSYGPRENMFRPSIDTLFRSAAVTYKNQCVGMLLSGRLNDGSAGMESIKTCNGLTVIQNPDTAEFKGMPFFAQQYVAIDYIKDLEEMTHTIAEIMNTTLPDEKEIPGYLIKENEIATNINSEVRTIESLGDPEPVTCPECDGPLWKVNELKTPLFRCHLGHSFSEEALLNSKESGLEEAMWVALRILEEKKMLLLKVIEDYKQRNIEALIVSYEKKLAEVLKHIKQLRKVMKIEK